MGRDQFLHFACLLNSLILVNRIMKILVTGGAGYIGSHAVLALLQRGNDVIVFDSLELGHSQAIDRINSSFESKVELFQGDLKNKKDLDDLFKKHEGIDGVVHFAAYSLVGESVKDPKKYYQNNVCGSLNLFTAMLENDVKNVVFSSTAATYGEPESIPIKEDDRQEPINPYGWSKLMIEKIFDDFHVAYGMRSLRLRYFNAAGASRSADIGEDHSPETHLIPICMQVALGQREKMYIFGEDYDTEDGTCIRDYIHVEDLIDAHLLALDKMQKEDICDYMNLGTQNGLSVLQIVDKCKEISGIDFSVEIGKRRAGDPDKLVADASKAKKILGWEPKLGLDEIIKSAWNWHRKNPKGF